MKMLLITFCCFISANAFSQNIYNKLGTGGLFTIKDASSNFLTLSQSSGQVNILKTLRLENTTGSGTGIIFKGTDYFLHNFGSNNLFFGINAGNFAMSSASNNIGIGQQSLSDLTTGNSNSAMGYLSLSNNTTGASNTAIGYESLLSNTTASFNSALGYMCLLSNTTGAQNSAFGYLSLGLNTTGSFNSALGFQSLKSNTDGDFNTAVGLNSLFSNTIGTKNTALGYNTGSNITTGDNLTLIGHNAQPTSGSANNQITLGDGSVFSLRCNVQTITSLSDARDKRNIKDLSLGLDFLMKVKPRLFNWDKREWYENNISDGSKMNESPTAGFIAQELDEVQTNENAEWLNLVLKDNPEKIEASYGNLLPVMVKAIQELKVESEELKVENVELKKEVESMRSINDKVIALEKLVNDKSSCKHAMSVTRNQNGIASKKGDGK